MAEEIEIYDATAPSAVVIETCRGCSRAFGTGNTRRSPSNPDFCVACAREERKAMTIAKSDNSGWVQLAIEQAIPLWEQQPGETTAEYDLWLIYRDLWPAVRPTVTKVAEALDVSVREVQQAFNRWTWSARLQAWIREVNADKTAELRASRREMVEDHIKLGEAMRKKMLVAVENLDPEDVTPNELVSLLKETQRLEETAREAYTAIEAETAADIDNMPQGLFEAEEKDGQPGNAAGLSVDDMEEIVGILSTAGVLQVNGARVGVRKTTTTELVAEEF